MCFVDGATSNIEIGSNDFEPICYKCLDCSSTFKAVGKKIKCPTCESTRVERV
jgi:Zn finger protein HypA/HybF involved in hydrogenase expression